MSYHMWGEEGVDWRGISDSARFIAEYLVRWGRIGVRDYKEKFGGVRVYCSMGWSQIHSITHPRHMYSRYPRWLWKLDVYYGHYLTRPLNWLVVPFHRWLYRRAYRLAVEMRPHLRLEILDSADWPEFLEGL